MVKYVQADSQALIQGMTANVATAKGVTEKMIAGSQQLIQAVDGEQLSGSAYTAGQGLFRDLILPTVERVDSAIDSIKEELSQYQSANERVSRWSVIDETIQNQLIQSYQRQIAVIDFQIQCSNKLGAIGGVTKIALEAIAFGNQRLEHSKNALNEKIKEEQEKLEALTEFQGETSGLFQESLTQLKIGMQGVEILGFTTVNPDTGAYLLPDGFDSTWFTSAKSMSVTARRKEIALTNAMDYLQLPEEARAYYQKIMEKALKNVPVDQWALTIQQLNEYFLFDDEGNILDISPLGVGNLKKIIVSKNGKYDSALTDLATSELTSEQLEAFKEDFPQLALGVMEFLTGLGINGLNLVGTYFSGGTLAMVGISQAAAVTGSAITAGGTVTIADAINKMGLASSTVNISFAQTYSQYHKDLTPNNEYQTGEHDYDYKTDDIGRLSEAEAKNLQLKTHKGRKRHNPNTPDKQADDHAGHVFADVFGGSPELNNLLSQAKNVNWKEYGSLERTWKKALEAGQKVSVKVKVNYQGTSFRPASYNVRYTIDGVDFSKIIQNIN